MEGVSSKATMLSSIISYAKSSGGESVVSVAVCSIVEYNEILCLLEEEEEEDDENCEAVENVGCCCCSDNKGLIGVWRCVGS